MDEAEKAFSKIKAKYETEVECKDGVVVMKHNTPMPKEDLEFFKRYTKEEVEEMIFSTGGFDKIQF